MNTPAKIGIERLKKVLISDKHFNPERLKDVMKSDILAVLQNYTDITSDNLKFNIEVDQMGKYKILINADCSRLKFLGSMPD